MTFNTHFLIPVMALALASVAQPATIQFVGAPTGVNDGSFYVLPYQLTIDAALQNVTCYDFLDEVSPGNVWQANILGLSDAADSGFFSDESVSAYERIAWLSAQTYSNSAEQIGLQYAIWDVFDPGVRTNPDSVSYSQAADTAASGGYAGFDFSNFRFIQEVGAVAGTSGTFQAFVFQVAATTTSQRELDAPIPEPSTAVLFAGGILLLLAARTRGFSRVEQNWVRFVKQVFISAGT
jgi:hypothetical protein